MHTRYYFLRRTVSNYPLLWLTASVSCPVATTNLDVCFHAEFIATNDDFTFPVGSGPSSGMPSAARHYSL